MFSVASGQVEAIIIDHPALQEVWVRIDPSQPPERAYNYPQLFHRIQVGETVQLNTSAVKLGLGTGGRHFVIPDSSELQAPTHAGHIMKLRYTPWQFPIQAAEETGSPYHQDLIESSSLEGTPVVAASLHSMLPGIIMGFRSAFLNSNPKIAYVMTDGAALPIALSHLVRELKAKQLLTITVTAGQSFGGDLEAVSIPSAMLIAWQSIKADLIIVSLGPGIVGTGTKMGFSGIEQSWVIDLAARLQGIPIVVPRVSLADARSRHQVISHHTLTILDLANQPAALPISGSYPPQLVEEMMAILREHNLLARHHWYSTLEPPAADLFRQYQLSVKSMGRGVEQDPHFFQSTVAAGYLAALAGQNQLSSLKKF